MYTHILSHTLSYAFSHRRPGLRNGDRVLEVNGVDATNLNVDMVGSIVQYVVQLIDNFEKERG